MTDTPKDSRTDIEFLIDHVANTGFDVKHTVNGGFIVEVYETGRGTVQAAFTDFDDLIAWIGSALNREHAE